MTDSEATNRSRWPHFYAVVLACATFPLIWAGGLVTTFDAGMAVPDWPTTYGYNMFSYPLSTWWSGPWDLFIEHGHRLLGALAGILTIALNVAIWRCDPRRWMRWVGAAALALVILQGLLGGMRVRLDSIDLARVHGCTGPLFFAVCVVVCVLTSRFWIQPEKQAQPLAVTAITGSWFLFAIAYLQLVLGSHLRHPGIQWRPGTFRVIVLFHVFTAVFLVLQSAVATGRSIRLTSKLRTPAILLALLLTSQFVLGIATWRAKYGWPSFLPVISETSAAGPTAIAVHNTLVGVTVQAESMSQAITVTGHVAVGSLILACAACYAVRMTRCFAVARYRGESASNRTQFSTPTLASVVVGVNAS